MPYFDLAGVYHPFWAARIPKLLDIALQFVRQKLDKPTSIELSKNDIKWENLFYMKFYWLRIIAEPIKFHVT